MNEVDYFYFSSLAAGLRKLVCFSIFSNRISPSTVKRATGNKIALNLYLLCFKTNLRAFDFMHFNVKCETKIGDSTNTPTVDKITISDKCFVISFKKSN